MGLFGPTWCHRAGQSVEMPQKVKRKKKKKANEWHFYLESEVTWQNLELQTFELSLQVLILLSGKIVENSCRSFLPVFCPGTVMVRSSFCFSTIYPSPVRDVDHLQSKQRLPRFKRTRPRWKLGSVLVWSNNLLACTNGMGWMCTGECFESGPV